MPVPFLTDFDDLAEAMAVPNPNRPIQEAIAGFGRTVCDSLSANPGAYALNPSRLGLQAACGPYWDSQGYDGPVDSPPPFEGGQCASVQYGVNIFRNPPGPGNVGSNLFANGPITELSATFIGNFQYLCRITGSNGSFTQTVNVLAGEGAPSLSLYRTDSQPDNCGDPPAGPPIPGPNPAPDPGPLPPGTGPTIDIRGNPILVLPPTLVVAPDISVDLPPVEVNIGGKAAAGGNAEPPIAGPEETGAGSGDGGGDNDFGEPPEGERWVGCCVKILTAPVGQGIIVSSYPNNIYPNAIGNVRLKFQAGVSSPTYDTPIRNYQETSCVWEPTRGLNPVGCFVNLLPGFTYSVTPYSVPNNN